MLSGISKFLRKCCCIPKKKKKVTFNHEIYNVNDITYLDTIEYKDTIPFIPPIVYGKVIKIYDGDTITIAAKLPYEGSPIYRFSVRLNGIDSPEIKGGSASETKSAIKSRDALHNLIFGKVVELRGNRKEKYGRLLADLYYDDGSSGYGSGDSKTAIHVNQWMIDNKYSVPYDGGKKDKFIE